MHANLRILRFCGTLRIVLVQYIVECEYGHLARSNRVPVRKHIVRY
jgi:hypothetical protein